MAIPLVIPAGLLGAYLLTGRRTGEPGVSDKGTGAPSGLKVNPGGSNAKGEYKPKTPDVAHTDDAKAKNTADALGVIQGGSSFLKKVPVVSQIAAVLTAQATGSYLLTKELTGSDTAAIASVIPGSLNIVNGVSIGLGVKTGELFSSAAGGQTDDFNRSSDAYSQGAGGTIAAGAIYISAYVAATVIAPLAFIGYGIASLFEDAARLGYGQPGINGRLQSLITEIQNRVVSVLGQSTPPDSLPMLELAGKLLGEAYAKAYNELMFNAWMKRNKGVTVSWKYHGVFGRDRGYFSGNVAGDGPTRESIQLVPTFTADFGALPAEFAANASFINAVNQFKAEANAYIYAKHMQKDARGFGFTNYDHARAGNEEGQYYGIIHRDWTSTDAYKNALIAAYAKNGVSAEAVAIQNPLHLAPSITVMLNGADCLLTPQANEDVGYLEFPRGQYWDWRTIAVKESEG